MKKRFWVLVLTCWLSTLAFATPTMSWSSWVAQLKQEAVQQGINPQLFDQLFVGLKPGKRQLHLNRSQPERRLTFLEYRKTRIDPYRIKLGKREYRRHKALLTKIGRHFQVDPCVIVATWGLETSYGRYLGSFPVIRSLSTLAYASNRKSFFRRELLYALEILQGGHVELKRFKGEWAGASGQAQFLPSSWHKYAVDFNGDGHKDIWTNLPDALASVANYLHENGWQYGEPWGFQVTVPAHFSESLLSLQVRHPMEYWFHHGVRPARGGSFACG